MKLKELRLSTGLNQTQTASKIGIPRLNYNKYELGSVEPNIQTLCQIADYYNVSLDYLCEHKTKGVIDLSNKSDNYKLLLKTIENLSDNKIVMLTGFAARLTLE